MTQAFNPFSAPPAQPAPVQPGPAAPARTQAVPTDMNDPALHSGGFAPYFRHIEGEFDIRVDGYSGTTAAQTPKLGRGVHITFTILTSSRSDVPVGSQWRISYQYNWEHSEKSDKDEWGKHMKRLSDFVHAVARQPKGAGFDAKATERQFHAHDWKAQPGYAHLSASLSDVSEKTGQRYRNDLWLLTAA